VSVASVCQLMNVLRGVRRSEQLLRPAGDPHAWVALFSPSTVDQPLQAICCFHIRVRPCYCATVRGITWLLARHAEPSADYAKSRMSRRNLIISDISMALGWTACLLQAARPPCRSMNLWIVAEGAELWPLVSYIASAWCINAFAQHMRLCQ